MISECSRVFFVEVIRTVLVCLLSYSSYWAFVVLHRLIISTVGNVIGTIETKNIYGGNPCRRLPLSKIYQMSWKRNAERRRKWLVECMQILGVPKKMCSRRIRPFVSSFLFTYFDFGPARRGNESGILSVGKYVRPRASFERQIIHDDADGKTKTLSNRYENSGGENIFARRLPPVIMTKTTFYSVRVIYVPWEVER